MRIGIDLDEVLCEFLQGLIQYHNEEFSTNLKINDFFSYNLNNYMSLTTGHYVEFFFYDFDDENYKYIENKGLTGTQTDQATANYLTDYAWVVEINGDNVFSIAFPDFVRDEICDDNARFIIRNSDDVIQTYSNLISICIIAPPTPEVTTFSELLQTGSTYRLRGIPEYNEYEDNVDGYFEIIGGDYTVNTKLPTSGYISTTDNTFFNFDIELDYETQYTYRAVVRYYDFVTESYKTFAGNTRTFTTIEEGSGGAGGELGLYEDLVSYYKLDETSGTNAEDIHGTNDGTANNARVFTSEIDGILNTGADFTQGDDYITLPDGTSSSNPFFSDVLSFSVWFKGSDLFNGIHWIYDFQSRSSSTLQNSGHSLRFVNGDLEIHWGWGIGNNGRLVININMDNLDIENDKLHHLVITWEINGLYKVYIDGVEKASGNAPTTSLDWSFKNDNILGYRSELSTGQNFDGLLDEVGIWDRALSAEEINELYELYNSGKGYPFQKDFQITAKDIYTDSPISTFNATITNSTDTFTLTTTNGTIIWDYPEEELVNITITATNLFNVVYTNYNVTNNLEAQMFNLVVTAKDRYNDASIDEFSLTYSETTFSTTNGTLRTNLNTPDLNELVSFTISSDDFFDGEYENHNVSSNLNAILWNKVNNLVVFKRADNSQNIQDLNVTLTRPDGSQLDLTTNSNGEIQFDFQEDFSVIQGTYSFLIPETFGFLTPVTFFVDVDEDNENIQETYFLSTTSIFVRVFDRITFDFLEKPTNLFFLGVFNETTSNGTYLQDNVTLGIGTYTVQALSDGYDTEQIEFIYTGVSQIIIDFYMMNLTDESAGTLFISVIDDFYRVINDAKVNLLEYDTTTKSYIKVSECKTNSNGECSFTIELNKKTYIITAQKNIAGVSNTATTNLGGEIIKTDNEVRNLVLRPSISGVSFLSQNILLDVEETFENNISTIFMEYSTIDNTIAEMCVEYFEVKSMNRTSVYVQCVNSSSSYSAVPILLNRSNNYEADVYLKSGQNYVFYTFRYQSEQSLQEILSTNNFISPFILLLWIVIIVFMLMTENVTVFAIAGLFLSWLEWLMFPSVVNATGSVLKTMILIFMYYVSRKKEDFN